MGMGTNYNLVYMCSHGSHINFSLFVFLATVKPLLTDTPNSRQSLYNGQHAMYQLFFIYD